MTDDPKRLTVPVGALLRVRGQLQASKTALAEQQARERAAQLALIQEYKFTISAVCDIYNIPRVHL
jgi:hypothetical protein